jgi:hypothetical protein
MLQPQVARISDHQCQSVVHTVNVPEQGTTNTRKRSVPFVCLVYFVVHHCSVSAPLAKVSGSNPA